MWNLGKRKSFLLASGRRATRVKRAHPLICCSGTSNRRFVCRVILLSTLSAGIGAPWSQPILMPAPGSRFSRTAVWHSTRSMRMTGAAFLLRLGKSRFATASCWRLHTMQGCAVRSCAVRAAMTSTLHATHSGFARRAPRDAGSAWFHIPLPAVNRPRADDAL